jgi:glutamate synthase domain-containing protein 2
MLAWPGWTRRLNQHFPLRYLTWMLCGLLALVFAIGWMGGLTDGVLVVVFLGLTLLGLRDARQPRHSILRNYPVIGHLRFLLEFIRPEIRQYFLEGDNDAAPFSRAQRSIVYQRAKGDPDQRPFGTQLDTGARGYEWINHSLAPTHLTSHDFRITIGAGRAQPYSASVFNISAMSFGALSANAILALNKGAKQGGFAHDTGEGSISIHHRQHGGDLIWEIGSGYFGCRNDDGSFSAEKFQANAVDPQVKMIELKLSQGAKPGHGGVLPGPKVTLEIAAARGVAVGVDCISPSRHSAFDTPVEMMQFIERLRTLSGGKPTGFKLCIGHPWEWFGIAKAMLETGITPDFIVVDGAEGGTGAAPLEFTDHVGAPLQEGLLLVHNTLVGLDLRHKVKIGCAGKVISAFDIARMMALGADRRQHAGPAAPARAGGAGQVGACLPLPPEHAGGTEGTGAGRGAAPSRGDHGLAHRAPLQRPPGEAAGQPAVLRAAGATAARRDAPERLQTLLADGQRAQFRGDPLNHGGREPGFQGMHRGDPVTTMCAGFLAVCTTSCRPSSCSSAITKRVRGCAP